ncbi:MAG: UDP-N-acetylmuramate dehydrogenase [Paludibacteraceae bacterium]|nr:UDP-N-acetylmuramate dehydrogenase [Paludibacteraceae bacterium]
MKTSENQSLLEYNTFGVDVTANYFVEYESVEELQRLLATDLLRDNKYFHIGGGSNLLFIGNYEGVILHSAIRGIRELDRTDTWVRVRAGAAEVWDDLVAWTVGKGYGGMENLSGIPGEVGATPVQNIGAYGCEVKDVIDEVECVRIQDGALVRFSNADCQFGYRDSIFKREWRGQYIVVAVTYKLQLQPELHVNYGSLAEEIKRFDVPTVASVREAVLAIRRRKLPEPKVLGNAGSFYLNPVVSAAKFKELQSLYPQMPYYEAGNGKYKIPAGWMIEQCGWKGKSVGPVAVHGHQALVLINKGGANGLDIINLSDSIRQSVRDRFGIDLTPEVNIIFG